MRRSELLRARWTAIDWKAKTITIEAWTSKVKRSRVIPLNAEPLGPEGVAPSDEVRLHLHERDRRTSARGARLEQDQARGRSLTSVLWTHVITRPRA
ncbi:hypothetical protein [Paraburkholderia azotifigens]|uniref:Tyr recombinase domain-containing protein n=1 Tax=Paraburkholderia azotifigens TaxID=2057004 RepID=A0ABU9QZE7_9BURK